jgi:zinc protease
VNEINGGGVAALRPRTTADIGAADAAAALRFYRERFANAADFNFFFAGPFTVETITPLLEKYIASLPSTGRPGAVAAPALPSFPSSMVNDTVRKGREPRSQVTLTFFADAWGDPGDEERATAIASILRARLIQRLRGGMGATYTVSAGWGGLGRGYGTLKVSFVCDPAAADSLTRAAIDEAGRLRQEGATAEEVTAARAARAQELTTRQAQNNYWIGEMERAQRESGSAAAVTSDVEAITRFITVEDLKDAARRYLPGNRYTVVTLLPETP